MHSSRLVLPLRQLRPRRLATSLTAAVTTIVSPAQSPFRLFSASARAMAASEYKLKGLSSLDLKNGQTKEVEVEGIEDGKVLLAKVQDQVHALSHKCTHYGAPLAKGVLTPEGRLTCPWHGACFNVKTGDIEDAPAVNPLHKFELVQKDGAVYVKADAGAFKTNGRPLNIKCQPKSQERVVVVGGGSGAFGTIEGLRIAGYQGEITVISTEDHPPIDRTKLSKALLADVSKISWRDPTFYKEAGVQFVKGEVISIDFSSKKVQTKAGQDYVYSKLVLASGGVARWLPLPGLKGDLGNVFLLRSVADVEQILKAAGDDGSKKVAVIGSSFIGMEAGNALAGKKHQVSIIGMEKVPLERVMGEKLGHVFQGLVEKSGVKFHMSASVEKGEPSKSDSSKIGAVLLKDGTSIEVDLVVEGVGVRPATDYLRDNSSVSLQKDGSLEVDESFAVKGLNDVFAVGDIATYPYHGPGGNGKPVRIEHWNVAQNAGYSVAKTIAQPGVRPKSFIPIFWSALGAQVRYCGHPVDGFDDVIIHGSTDISEGKQSFAAYYAKGDEIVAVATMSKDPYMAQSAELMLRNKFPSKSDIAKGLDIMEISLPSDVKI